LGEGGGEDEELGLGEGEEMDGYGEMDLIENDGDLFYDADL
jgi:hypothetical protein